MRYPNTLTRMMFCCTCRALKYFHYWCTYNINGWQEQQLLTWRWKGYVVEWRNCNGMFCFLHALAHSPTIPKSCRNIIIAKGWKEVFQNSLALLGLHITCQRQMQNMAYLLTTLLGKNFGSSAEEQWLLNSSLVGPFSPHKTLIN